MSKGGDDREQRAHIREAQREGTSASEAGVSTGADKQIGHGDQEKELQGMHERNSKS